jgi:hypothetical protein
LILFQNIAGAATERRFRGNRDTECVAFSGDSKVSATAAGRHSIQVATGDRGTGLRPRTGGTDSGGP